MPSGQTHDRITLWALPFVAGATFAQTKSGNLTLLVASGFMFGGLMFGPDLDIYSRQYQRWGLLRWIWIPYQKSLRHRSFLSHGPIIGTTLRVIYLSGVVGILVILGTVVAQILGNGDWSRQFLNETVGRSLNYIRELLALFSGLELGAMSHSLSDWSNSAYKRFQKQGVRSLLPRAKMKKRKRTTTQSNRTRTKRASKAKKH
ncbi:metal-binding protein [Fischerella major NIES-592]|uniref:Metal-binding protein n=2 Tax=Fischerella TaxID=1190 RepID=A0A1U7H4M1_9CYAN|nr:MULTISPECIES: metal-binding protein [Fischerella]OKH16248.1 metal-binding protein [Fischerella major NIES-592]PMB45229.1 metal-binding protein [Fischerella thermalis CCMEE 5330]